jgi:hypothetical protein
MQAVVLGTVGLSAAIVPSGKFPLHLGQVAIEALQKYVRETHPLLRKARQGYAIVNAAYHRSKSSRLPSACVYVGFLILNHCVFGPYGSAFRFATIPSTSSWQTASNNSRPSSSNEGTRFNGPTAVGEQALEPLPALGEWQLPQVPTVMPEQVERGISEVPGLWSEAWSRNLAVTTALTEAVPARKVLVKGPPCLPGKTRFPP